MHHPRITTALLVATTLTAAACGRAQTDDSDPVGRQPTTTWDHVAAAQAYYDMTHPPPKDDAPPGPAEAFQVYYDLTHPIPTH